MTDKKPGDSDKKLLRRVIKKIVIYTAIIVLALSFVIGIYRIDENDMYPSLMDGDLVICYRLGTYHTGDVVIYKSGSDTRCGRVTATAGDEVMIMEDGFYSINGNVPFEKIFYPTMPGSLLTYPFKVEEDKVFIMGDMRQQAEDSRKFGSIPVRDIKGKVVLLLFRGRGF